MRQIGAGTTLIERADWGARASRATTWITPTEGVTGHWEGNGIGWPWPHETCFSLVRGIQAFHMDARPWSDIAYNGLACPHGYVFEGRGPSIRSAGHGEPGNSLSYALCFLSGVADEFTPEQHRAWADGRLWLIQEGGATDVLHCHRDWMNTQCPGDDRCAWIKAGALAPSTPAPAPTPAPIPLEDDMRIFWPRFVDGDNGALWLLVGDKLKPIATSAGAAEIADQCKVVPTEINPSAWSEIKAACQVEPILTPIDLDEIKDVVKAAAREGTG